MNYVPMVIENVGNTERAYDIRSRLLKDRIIILSDQVNNDSAMSVVSQLLFLDSVEKKDITMYINSPGGVISDGLAVYDTMNLIQSDVSTVCVGNCASMAAFLLAAGTKGKRMILPNSEVMIHQPLGGTQGQCSDIQIQAKHIEKTKNKMNKMMAEFTGKDIETIEKDTDRDNWLSAEEALEYGLVDKIL